MQTNKWIKKRSCLRVTCMVARIAYIPKNGWNAHFRTQLLHDKSRKCHTTCASFQGIWFRRNNFGLVIGCKIMRTDQPSMHLMPRFPSHSSSRPLFACACRKFFAGRQSGSSFSSSLPSSWPRSLLSMIKTQKKHWSTAEIKWSNSKCPSPDHLQVRLLDKAFNSKTCWNLKRHHR